MSTLQEARESISVQPSNLWAHVFGKSSSTLPSNSGTPLPPLGPIDKNATSTRILLHDTQANLEKFSTRIDALLDSFSEAKTEVKLVKTLFERDRETLMNDIIDLVNRCQTQIQKAVGSPAQDLNLDNFSRDVDHRFENLDKRLDAIQMLSKTHAQSLQTQIQVIQSLQEQQCSILAALVPLMPLLQAIPLHIDSAKNSILDTIRITRQQMHSHAKAIQTLPVEHRCKDDGINKRPRTTSLSDNLASLTSRAIKKSRIDSGTASHLSKPTPVRNRICSPTTPNPPKPSSNHNQTTPFSGTGAITCLPDPGRKIICSGTRKRGSQQASSQQHILTLGDTSQVVTTDATNSMKRACVTRDKSNHSIQKGSTSSLDPNSRKAETNQTTTYSAIPVQQIQAVNDLRRTSTQSTTLNIALAQGSQASKIRQLRSTMTSIPAKSGFPPRRRRTPPKKGRRFIPLLDSDDEEIASP